jgi:hypothetical protein
MPAIAPAGGNSCATPLIGWDAIKRGKKYPAYWASRLVGARVAASVPKPLLAAVAGGAMVPAGGSTIRNARRSRQYAAAAAQVPGSTSVATSRGGMTRRLKMSWSSRAYMPSLSAVPFGSLMSASVMALPSLPPIEPGEVTMMGPASVGLG